MSVDAIRGALLQRLVQRTRDRGYDIGRTKLQKLVFFLQDLAPVPKYRYELRHYGPYSYELSSDVERLASLGFIDTQEDQSGYGYHIYPGHRSLVDSEMLVRFEQAINQVVENFASLETAQLEIMSTIRFVDEILASKGRRPQQAEVLDLVWKLKPHYEREYVDQCAQLLGQRLPLHQPTV
jgi:uncharacterized protein